MWHGCPSCYKGRDYDRNVFNGLTFKQLNQQWEQKKSDLESKNIQVNWIWECQFNQLQKDNTHIHEYVKGLEMPRRLIPRNGLRGYVKME